MFSTAVFSLAHIYCPPYALKYVFAVIELKCVKAFRYVFFLYACMWPRYMTRYAHRIEIGIEICFCENVIFRRVGRNEMQIELV